MFVIKRAVAGVTNKLLLFNYINSSNSTKLLVAKQVVIVEVTTISTVATPQNYL